MAAAAYTAYSANATYQAFERGRADLLGAQGTIGSATNSTDTTTLAGATAHLQDAEHAFAQAQRRAEQDPALRFFSALPGSGPQVQATARLGAIGADLSRAGESAAAIAQRLATLKQRYQGPITAEQLPALLQQAQAIAVGYQETIDQIGVQLRAAHAERAQVTTTDLVQPLQHAYDEVDQALDRADTAFVRYQDVKQVLADFLGVTLPL